MPKRALITGASGQDGSYLIPLLLEKGYEVMGLIRRNSVPENQTTRINQYMDQIYVEYADMTDLSSLERKLLQFQPDEIYNTAAQSHVKISFDEPIHTAEVTGIGTLNLLEAIRFYQSINSGRPKLLQCSSSEMFGNRVDPDGFQRETTPMHPVSPYGCAKLFAHSLCRNYRNAYGMFITNAITFNHESPLRAKNFVTRKIVYGAVEIKKGLRKTLELGNLEACRDWSHAKDVVDAFWQLLQLDEPDDFIIASSKVHSVREVCAYVFNKLDLNYQDYVVSKTKYERPEELHLLKGSTLKLRSKIKWEPKYDFYSMLDEMIEHELTTLNSQG